MTSRVNLLSPELRTNPYPFFAELRRLPTLVQVDPGGFWAVARYADFMHVLKNPLLFSSAGNLAPAEPEWLGRRNPFVDSMTMMDPPRHTRLRTLVNRAFSPASIARLESRIRGFAREAVAELPLGQPVDFIETFALRVPAAVMAELLGLDASLRSRFKRWSDDIVNTGSTPPDAHEWHAQIRQTFEEMEDYLQGVIDDRRRHPREDLVSDLLAARVDGESLTNAEILAFLFLLLVAGFETTVHLLGHAALVLSERPELLARLRAERSRMPAFIEEVLRFDPPAQSLLRVTTAETELSGTRLPAGALVLLLVGSACRDETQFPDPDRFDIDRDSQKNVPFGHGVHFCLGSYLARLEARLCFEALLDRCSGLTREPGPVQWNHSLIVRGPQVLPVVLQAE